MENVRLDLQTREILDVDYGTICLQPIMCCELLKSVKYNQAKSKYSYSHN